MPVTREPALVDDGIPGGPGVYSTRCPPLPRLRLHESREVVRRAALRAKGVDPDLVERCVTPSAKSKHERSASADSTNDSPLARRQTFPAGSRPARGSRRRRGRAVRPPGGTQARSRRRRRRRLLRRRQSRPPPANAARRSQSTSRAERAANLTPKGRTRRQSLPRCQSRRECHQRRSSDAQAQVHVAHASRRVGDEPRRGQSRRRGAKANRARVDRGEVVASQA